MKTFVLELSFWMKLNKNGGGKKINIILGELKMHVMESINVFLLLKKTKVTMPLHFEIYF